MSNQRRDRQFWADFLHTLHVSTGAALAEFERNRERGNIAWRDRASELVLLAAATGAIVLPDKEVTTTDGLLSIRFVRSPGEVRVQLQLRGFNALREFANRRARLTTPSGTVDYSFQFDARGAATCILADTPPIVAELAHVIIRYDQAE